MNENFLLRHLHADERALIQPHMSVVTLDYAKILAEPRERIERVYFPRSGILQFTVDLPEGGAIATGMMGRDGVFGATQALDERVSLNRVTVQTPGTAIVLASTTLCDLALKIPRFRKLILAYDQFFFAYVQQTAACNAVHNIRQRCCRWLVRMHNLAGDNFQLTQEFLAQMMGVRRTSVTAVAQELQAAGLVSYQRGNVTIRDLDGVRAWACLCENETDLNFERVFYETESLPLDPQAIAAAGGFRLR